MQEFLADLLEKQYPFVLFRFPQKAQVHCYYQSDNTTHWTCNFEEEGFVFAPFVRQQKQLMVPASQQKSFALSALNASSETPVLPHGAKVNFEAKVTAAVQKITDTALEKVVLSNAFDLTYQGEGSAVFTRLANTYTNAFVYYWFHPETGQWLGASPERLVTLENGHFSTVALAGTLPSGESDTDWTEKEKHEQQIVVDAIVDGLRQSGAAHNIQVGERTTVQAGKLFHLQTPINAAIEAGNLLSLVQYLHPTPAVGGLPKAAAVDYIHAHEDYDRAYYTGFLGPFSKRVTANFFVNLRCGKLSQNSLRIYTGAGITAGSDPNKEWEEICRKATTFLSAL